MRMEATSSSQAGPDPSLSSGGDGPDKAACCKERKLVHNASSKVSLVVQRMLLPLLETPMRTHVVFDVDKDQAELDLMDQLEREKPEILEDSKSFVQHLQGLYDRYKQGVLVHGGAYSRVHPPPV